MDFGLLMSRLSGCRLPWSFRHVAILVFHGLLWGLWIGCSPLSNERADIQSSPSAPAESSGQPTYHSWHRTSQYLTMRDGIRIAVDLYVPDGLEPGARIPTILHQTRYWRAIDYRWPLSLFTHLRPRGLIGQYAERFLQQGYAWVSVDVRGSGASFGTRPVAWSPAEIKDGAEIVDWIVAHPWSNGNVGALGISYSGGAAEMLLMNQHPAVKAAAPMFAGFDLYSDIAFPGGIHLKWFTKTWSDINHHLDHNELPFANWMVTLFVRGVSPVDADPDTRLLAMALQEHEANWSPFHEASGITFRDDAPPSRHIPNIDALSPQSHATAIGRSGAAIFSYSGWFDGGYGLAAIKRHLHYHNPANRLILGPWDHGGKRRISPSARGPAQFDHAQELLHFFNRHLNGHHTGIPSTLPVRYYTMGAEQWRASAHWPPASVPTSFYFHPGHRLARVPSPPQSPPDSYHVDPTAGTGRQSRWNTLAGIALTQPYSDRLAQDHKLLTYTSDPLPRDLEVTGHPIATIYLSANASDTTLFVYLEDVTPDGRVQYVTEGELRALHRKTHPADPTTHPAVSLPHHTFRRADAAPLIPGDVVPFTLDLLPVSYQFKKGHRIRVALAGADKDHFQLLDGTSPTWHIWHTTSRPSHLELPVIPSSSP